MPKMPKMPKVSRKGKKAAAATTPEPEPERAATPATPTPTATAVSDSDSEEEMAVPAPARPVSPALSQGSDGSTSSRKSRKLTDEQEDTLCVWLAENPYLWDQKQDAYRNVRGKEDAWRKQAAAMGLTVDHIKGAFKNLRDWNNQIDKQIHKSGSGQVQLTGRQKVVVERLKFLKRTVTHRPASIRSVGSKGSATDRSVIASADEGATRTPSRKKSTSSVDSDAISDLTSYVSAARQNALNIVEQVQKLASQELSTTDQNFEKKKLLPVLAGAVPGNGR